MDVRGQIEVVAPNDRQRVKVPRGLSFAVLRLIGESKHDAYGIKLRAKLSEITGSEIPAGQIYVILSRLEEAGLIIGVEERKKMSAARIGRPRRLYEVTALGQQALSDGAKLYG
jgi:DNA-binding PadR family transcriptional regulator